MGNMPVLWRLLVFLLHLVSYSWCDSSSSSSSSMDSIETFHKLFTAKRIEQLQAVKNILTLDADKQKSLLDTVSVRLFEVISRSKVQLEGSGFLPGPDLPAVSATREALSLLIENTCLFSDILLRLPNHMHTRLTAKHDWELAFRWAVGFVKDFEFLDAATRKLLHLAAQELNLVERDPEYRNPYRVERQPQKRFEDPPPPVKKARKKVKRGPKMSHSEL